MAAPRKPDRPGKQGQNKGKGKPEPPVASRWKPGQSGNPRGRRPAPDFRALVEKRLTEQGESLEQVLWAVFVQMLKQARAGDVQAQRMLLDRLCLPIDRTPLVALIDGDVNVNTSPDGPPLPSTDEEISAYMGRLFEFAEEARKAAQRPRITVEPGGNGRGNGKPK